MNGIYTQTLSLRTILAGFSSKNVGGLKNSITNTLLFILNSEGKAKWCSKDKRNFCTWVYERINRETVNPQLQFCVLQTNLQRLYPIDPLQLHPILSDQWRFSASYWHWAVPHCETLFRSSNTKPDAVNWITIIHTERWKLLTWGFFSRLRCFKQNIDVPCRTEAHLQ